MEEFKHQHKRLWQLVEYFFSGGLYFWFGYLLLDGFYYGLHWSLWWSTAISSVLGWIFNYLMQRYWVFKNAQLAGRQTQVSGRYVTITIVNFFLNYVLLVGFKNIGITPAISQFFNAGFFFVWSYFWYRFWVFPDKADNMRLKVTVARFFAHLPHGHSAYMHHAR